MKSVKRHLEIMTTLNENTVTIPMVRKMAQRALDDMTLMKLNTGSLYGQIDSDRRYYAIDPARSDDMIDAIRYAFKSPAMHIQRMGRAVRYRRKWWQLWKRKAPKTPLILDFESYSGFDIPWMKKLKISNKLDDLYERSLHNIRRCSWGGK